MRRPVWIALLAGFALAASPAWGAPRLVTWKHTTSRFVHAADSPFNGVPADAPAKPQALPVNVLLPDGFTRSKRYPVLYLLHGHGDSYWSWYSPSNGDLLRTAAGFRGIVVMPEGGQGWYTDWWNGGKRGSPGWESYHLRELVPLVEKRLPVRRGRRWHAIAGLSMGGEATMYYASQLPGYFGSAAAFSPPVSIQRPEWPSGFNTQGQDFNTVFGPVDGFYATGHNPLRLVANLRWTRLFVGVGDGTPQNAHDAQNVFGQLAERDLRMHADDFVAAAHRDTSIDVTYHPRQGIHDWPYWREHLADAIQWGFFRPVGETPAFWWFSTVETASDAWGFHLAFDKPPETVETFHLHGKSLSATGSGTVTVTTPQGITFTKALPFDAKVPQPKRPAAHTRHRAGHRRR
jgi:S-formylglutathione hydrolase FrmB